ncbi:hypothetical protein X766_15910 [Mesorhizobium sp. LSJC255A00]|uniref:hypothetical protein n=1 Tax=Mesorhizobium sp. LSJC255A00 TaxID=1287313 RepID=UPI0003CE296A|nr:hypothetical protein [Mesorhizobium sp. LSJC255A00]ESX17880.1 hypothetical protein X766_15910 [Mesorhizobium sp. LSJC255A00]
MAIDPNDPKMDGYIPLQDYIDQDQDQSSRRIRDMPYGKHKEDLEISVASLAFANTGLNQESGSQAIVLTNAGYGEVNILFHQLSGDFLLKSSLPEKLLPGETATIQVAFKPISLGPQTGGLYLDTGNASGDEFVELIGTGIVAVAETKLSYTAVEIAAIGNAVNTVGKVEGLTVWDKTNHRTMTASGPAANAAWWNAMGTVSVVPA